MAVLVLVIAAGIFIMGAAIGLVAVVSIGIRHEERLFRDDRRYQQQHGSWPGPDGPDHHFAAVPPGLVSHGARALTGLWIRRSADIGPLAIPWYERRR